jgi:hypothetical protein
MSLLDEAIDLFGKFAKNLRDRGLEYTSGRYYGKYMGFVEDAADPQGQGRVKVSCEVANGRTVEIEKWALPSADYAGQDKGLFLPPDKGDVVWVWFDHGDRSQPRYSGSFWGNTDPAKAPSTSDVPAEFRLTPGAAPTRRGLKTKAGHGWLFEDSADAGKKYEVWTGEQTAVGDAATKHHRVVLNDTTGEEEVLITSFGEQKVRLIDVAGQESIEVTTKNGLFTKLLDYLQKIEAGGPLGFKLTIDEQVGRIALETPAGNKVEILEAGGVILIQDAAANTVQLSPAGINVTSTALVNIVAASTVALSAAAAAAISAGGPLTLTGAGMSIASVGGAPSSQLAEGVTNNSFIGLKSETLAGGLVQVVLGLWQIGAVIADIISPALSLGTPGAKFVLMDSRFVALFNAHTHKANAPLMQTDPPLDPAIIGLHTTTAVAAN